MTKEVVIIGGGIAGIYVLRTLLARKSDVEEEMNFTVLKLSLIHI